MMIDNSATSFLRVFGVSIISK